MISKKIIVETMKRLYTNRFISIRDGNISFKPKNENYFYISAGSIKKNEIDIDQVIKVNFEKKDKLFKDKFHYDLFYDKSYIYKPSREINMHALLQTHPFYNNMDTFVVHAHPPNIIGYLGVDGVELNSIKKIFPEINVGEIGKNVKYHDAGSENLAKNCFVNLYKKDIIGLERHGSLSIGSNIDKIFEDIETLEYYIDVFNKMN